MPARGKAPTRLGISVRVQEKWGAKRTGIIKGHAVGKGAYMVDFDGEEGSPEEKKNSQLRIYQEAYGKQKTPVSKIAATIRAALPKTGRVPRRRKNNGMDDDVGASETDRESPIGLRMECEHSTCMAKQFPAKNKHGPTKGVFICNNINCIKKHWKEVHDLSRT